MMHSTWQCAPGVYSRNYTQALLVSAYRKLQLVSLISIPSVADALTLLNITRLSGMQYNCQFCGVHCETF